MISTKSLLWGLTALTSLDILLSTLAVGYMGAIELNSMASILGFPGFIVLKIIASAAAICTIYIYCIPTVPLVARYGMMMMCAVYGVTCVSNMYQIVGAAA